MKPEPISVHVKLTHPNDQALRSKLEWFRQQPGIVLTREELSSGPERFPKLEISRKGVVFLSGEERLRFHPSMALLRLISIQRGEPDRFLEATRLETGDSFLDATLGLAVDALIAAFAVGPTGKVVGIEHSAILAALTKDGLSSLAEEGLFPSANGGFSSLGKMSYRQGVSSDKLRAWISLRDAAPRIQVLWGEHLEFLRNLPDRAFDVVYFDPMFRRTRVESASIRPLHFVAEHAPLTEETIAEACRVACKRVVLKERKGSGEFTRLGFQVTASGRYSPVDYGVIILARS